MLKYVFRFIPLLLSTLFAFFSMIPAGFEKLEADISGQVERINQLEQGYKNGEIKSVDESSFFDGNLETEINNGLKFNELRYIATHNSYQTYSTEQLSKIFKNLSDLTFGLVSSKTADFVSPTITEQLNNGIYSLELDIETFDRKGEVSFTCMHSPCFEMGTSCYDFSLALKEIAMWSDNNPNHLPITIIIEPKEIFLPMKDMKFFNVGYAVEFDKTLREGLGDKLFTPADMLGDYDNFAQLRADDGWCEVKDMLGKVLILFHNCNVTEDYISIDESLRSQAMFPMLYADGADRECASFILANKPEELMKIREELLDEKKLVVRTRSDKFTEVTEDRRKYAFESGAQIISTDYPVKSYSADCDYIVSFGGIKTISIR